MRFLILRETGFSTFMSSVAVICAGMAIMFWSGVFDEDYTLLGPAVVLTVICILFYALALSSARKSVKKRAEAEAQYRADHPGFFTDKK